MRFMNGLAAFFDRMGRVFIAFAAILLLAMIVLINVEVTGRYLLGFSTLISDEYSGYLFCWIVMLGLLFALRSDRLLRVDAIYLMVPRAIRRVLDIVSALLGTLLCGILTYAVWETLWLSWLFNTASNSASETRLYLIQFMMPLGLGMLTLAFAELMIRRIVAPDSAAERDAP